MAQGWTKLLTTSSALVGSGSMAAFGLFLCLGPVHFVDLERTTETALAVDAGLCLLFFLQHSLMIRKSYRSRLERILPRRYHAAQFAFVSGVALLALVVLWQPTGVLLASATGVARWGIRLVFFLAFVGILWGFRALGSPGDFVKKPVRDHERDGKPRLKPLKIRGPYRWVRHPLYFFVITMIWANPDLTADRLLLNVLTTMWMVLGAVLEERDLVQEFGEPYLDYRREVPMLIPYRGPRGG